MTVIKLGPEGLNWIRQSLRRGGDFSELILREMELEAGRSWAAVPAATAAAGVSRRFAEGPAPGGARGQYELFDERARDLTSTGAALLVENDLWRPGEPSPRVANGIRVVIGSTEVAVFSPEVDMSPQRFVKRHSSGYPSNVFFLKLEAAALAHDPANSLVSGTRHLIAIAVAAWDAEGFIWWTRVETPDPNGGAG